MSSFRAIFPEFRFSEDGDAVLVHADGTRRPLHRAGQPLAPLQGGWSAGSIHVVYAPILIVSLQHQGSAQGHWIVDITDEAYGQPVSKLPEALRTTMRQVTRRLLRDVRAQGDAALADWNAMPRTTRLELLADAQRDATPLADNLIDIMGGRADDTGDMLEVRTVDDVIAAVLSNGIEIPVLLEGRPLRHSDFHAGWAADVLYRDFAPFFLLELRHETGVRASWLLDGQLRVLGDVTTVPRDTKDDLCACAASVIDRHLASVLAFAEPESDPVVERYLRLNEGARLSLVAHCAHMVRAPLRPISPGQLPTRLPVSPDAARLVLMSRDAACLAVRTDMHEQTIKGILHDGLEWPSPVDGSAARLRGIFTLDEYLFFYQFTDRNQVDFLIIASDRSCRLIGLVLPAVNLVLWDDRVAECLAHDIWLRNTCGVEFWTLLIRHVNQYADEMAARSRTAKAGAVNVLLTNLHIGHHLWNDLSGIQSLCDAVPPDRLPTTMIIGAPDGRAELFGPIETLFPATKGHVDRSLPDVDAFIRWTYRHDVWPARITREYVSAALRRKVTEHLASADEAVLVSTSLPERREGDHATPIIIFGLRVEDRTFADLPAFCEAFVAFMVETHPGSVIIFDGYNCHPGSPSGQVIRGMAHGNARQPPEEVEAHLVVELGKRFAGAPVTIIGTTGQSIATSLAWCSRADAAIAIWGAGLTKYRWLANLPTMMISSCGNMLTRADIRIYHDPAFMETPTRTVFPDPALITDTPWHVGLAVGHVQGGRECFTADNVKLLLEFDAFLMTVLQQARGQAAPCPVMQA